MLASWISVAMVWQQSVSDRCRVAEIILIWVWFD